MENVITKDMLHVPKKRSPRELDPRSGHDRRQIGLPIDHDDRRKNPRRDTDDAAQPAPDRPLF